MQDPCRLSARNEREPVAAAPRANGHNGNPRAERFLRATVPKLTHPYKFRSRCGAEECDTAERRIEWYLRSRMLCRDDIKCR
mmetsp:Transcript_32781/g.64958  ORF Transcript_32781/g.64958 Transcript_32781/m.64958 type:complete len:82 (-) Transcript_32781:484-729(-)